MAFFDDMINGIRGIFGGDNKSQAQKSPTNVAKGTTGVFSSATQNANPLDEEEKRRREAERTAAEEARRREEEERKAREEEERRKAEEERKRQAEAERQRVEAERQKRVEQYKAMTSRGELNAQNEYNRQFETLRKEKLKQLEDNNGWFNNAFDGTGKQREELAKNQAHNEIIKKMHDEGMIDYASGDKKVQELVADRGGRNHFNYDFFENAEKNFSDKQRAFDTGKELYGNQSMKKLNGKTASELIDSYNNLSGDDQAEIREHLQKLQYKYTQNDEADKAATVAQFFGLVNKDQNSFINQKDTSIARQIGKTAASGGFVGDLAKTPENIIAQGAEMLGDKNAKKRTRISQYNHDIDNSNTGGVGVANKGFEAAANIGLNATGVGKAKILVDQVGGWIGSVDKAEAEKVLDYDEDGKPTIRNKNFDEKLGTYGGQTLNTVLAGLNLKGIGPNMGSLDGLNKVGIAKELGKYYAKEIPYAAGTGYLNANLQHMTNGGKFGEADMGQIAGEVLQDVVLDTGMDLRGSIANRGRSNSLKDLHHDVRNVLAKKTPEGNVNISKLHLDQMGFNKDELVGKFTGDTRKRMSDMAFKVLQEQRVNNPYVTNDGGEISLTNKGNKKYISTKSPETDAEFSAKMRSAPRIDEIIGGSSYSHSAIDSKNHGIAPEGFDYRNSNFRYGGNDFETILNVAKSDSRGDTLYGGLTKEKNHSGGLNAAPGELVLPGPNDSHNSNISQNTKKVNGDYKYSDDIRNKLSPEQEAFFENSKIRDENGNLMKVYHGTNAEFDVFNPGNNSSNKWGDGNYLAYDRDIASNYGSNLKEMYANITSPVSDSQKTVSFEQYDALYRRLNDGEPAYREDYDMYGSDLDMLWDITDRGQWPKYAQDIKETTGKDGIIMNDMAITFSPEQTKYADNLNPTDSPDMRYKIQTETAQLTAKLDELKSRHQNLTGDEDLVFNIFKDEIQKNALGYFDPKTNKINLNDLTTDTLNHEIGHKIFSRVPIEQKADLISEIRSTFGDEALISKYGKDYGDDINILAEERLADGFNEYYQGKLNGEDSVRLGTRLGIPPKVLAYYDRMIEAIKSVFGATDELKKFYAEIETGKFAENHFADISKMVGGEAAYRISQDSRGDLVEIDQNIFEGVAKKDRSKTLKKYLQDNLQGNEYRLNYGADGEAKITNVSVNKMSNPLQNNSLLNKKGQIVSELPDILTISQKTGWAPDGKNHSFARDGFEYRQSRVKLGDEIYTVNLNVGLNKNGKLLYEINDIKKEPWNREDTRLNHSSYTDSVSQNVDEVKYKADFSEADRAIAENPMENIPTGIVKGLKTENQPEKRKFDHIAEQFAGQEVPDSIKRDVDMVLAKSRGELRAKSSSQPQGVVKNLKVENQPTDVKEILSNKQFENVPMANDKIMTKGNLYEQVKVGSTKGDWWSKPQRDGDWEYQLHHRKTKDGKKFSQFERRYVGDDSVGEWQPYSRALYMWKTQNSKIDAANSQEAIQDAITTAREDGQIKDYVYRQNHKQEWETVPLTGKVTLDGGFVRDPESGEIIGNHIQVTPFGVVNQIGGKYRVVETDNLVSVDPNKSGVTDTFTRKIEKLMDGEGEEYMKGLVDEKRQRYSKFAEELESFNSEHFELAKRIDKDFRPKNAKEKEFWEDVGRLSENTLQVKGLSGEDAFRSKYGENALIGAKEYTEYMRGNYDRWIKEANEVRRMLGKDEIEYRKNYMPHIEKDKGFFGKMASSVGIKGDIEGESRGEIPAKIAGLTANFSPNKKFNANEQQRTGAMKDYELDPRKVAEQYADLILYNKHMEPLINRGRSVEASMRALDSSSSEGLFQDPDSKLKDGGVVDGVHTVAVKDWVDELAGKSSSIDRPLIDRTNRSIQIIRKLENINGANKIMGNISSTFAQALNLPETVRQNGLKNTGKAILDAFNPEARKAMESSPFLKERYVDTSGKFTKTTSQKVSDKVSAWTGMNLVEGAFIRLNWGANYNRLKSKYSGNELVVQTDRATAKTVGARGIGDMPQAYRSALGKIFLQFTYENNESFKNNIEHAKGIVKNLKTGKKAEAGKMALHSAEAYVTAMALNALYGAVTGNKPLPEPITEFAGMVADNLDEDEKNDKNAGNFAAKGLEQLGKANPIVGAGLNMLPKDDRKNIFGSESDFGRFDGATGVAQTASNAIKGGINLLGGNIDDATTNLAGLIPMGSQIKKTIGGVSTMVKGEHTKTDKNGKEQTVYKVDNSNPLKWAQAAVFGRNALSETQDHYAGKDQKKQTPSAENTGSLNELSMKFAEERQTRLKDDENYKNSPAKLIDDMAIKIGKGEWELGEDGLIRDSKTGKIQKDHYEKINKALRKEGTESRDVYKEYLNSYEGRELEYQEAKKDYDEKLASGELSKKQQIKEAQELKKLEAQKDWEKEYRDAYSLAESSSDIKEYYSLYQTDEERATVRGKLNAINDRMLEKGLISQKTYNSRYKNINEIESDSKGGGRKGSSKDTFDAPNLPNFKVSNAPTYRRITDKGKGIVKGLKVSTTAKSEVKELPKVRLTRR